MPNLRLDELDETKIHKLFNVVVGDFDFFGLVEPEEGSSARFDFSSVQFWLLVSSSPGRGQFLASIPKGLELKFLH